MMKRFFGIFSVVFFFAQVGSAGIGGAANYYNNLANPASSIYAACVDAVGGASNFASAAFRENDNQWDCMCHSNPNNSCGTAQSHCLIGEVSFLNVCLSSAADPGHKPEKSCDNPRNSDDSAGEPIHPMSGSMSHHFELFRVEGAFPIVAAYDYRYDQGGEWLLGHSRHINVVPGSPEVLYLIRDDGSKYKFIRIDVGDQSLPRWESYPGTPYKITSLSGGGWDVTSLDGLVETYDATGLLSQIKNANGLVHAVAYQYSGADLVSYTVTDVASQSGIQYSVDSTGKVTAITLLGSTLSFSFAYNAAGMLSSVTGPDGVEQYFYGKAFDATALTEVKDETGQSHLWWDYDATTKFATLTKVGVNSQEYTVAYTVDGNGVIESASVTNASGNVRTYYYESGSDGLRRLKNVVGSGSGSCIPGATSIAYDAYGFAEKFTDVNGVVSQRTRDQYSRLIRTYKGLDASALPTQASSHVVTAYVDSATKLPASKTYYGSTNGTWQAYKKVIFTYYANNNRVATRTEKDLTAAAYPDRVWTYTYSPSNTSTAITAMTVTNPESAVTTYNFNNGLLASIVDHQSNATSYSGYNALNLPTVITDANGVITNITYDVTGKTKSIVSDVGGLNSTLDFDYYVNGLLKKITRATGTSDESTLEYFYNSANHLIGLKNNFGDYIEYAPSLLNGAWVTQKICNGGDSVSGCSGLTLSAQFERVFDEQGNVSKIKDAAGVARQTFGYDVNKNQVSHILHGDTSNQPGHDDQDIATLQEYDALNRLTKKIGGFFCGGACSLNTNNIFSGTTPTLPSPTEVEYEYNVQGLVSKVTAGGTVIADYTYNGFGDLIQEVSPSRGTISYSYNKVGRLMQKIDGRPVTTKYQYDPLGRLVAVYFGAQPGADPLDVQYTYDQNDVAHGKGKGRLTSFSDNSGATDYKYDALGRLVSEQRQLNVPGGSAITATTVFAYSAGGRLSQITYPGGRIVDYTQSGGHISGVVTQQGSAAQRSLYNGIIYRPFGVWEQVVLPEYDNSYFARTFDLNGRLQQFAVFEAGAIPSDVQHDYAYDVFNNIVSISYAYEPSLDKSYAYDEQHRLVSVKDAQGLWSYSYRDQNGIDTLGDRTHRSLQRVDPVTGLGVGDNVLDESYTYANKRLTSVARTVRQYPCDAGNPSRTPPCVAPVNTRSMTYDGSGNLIEDDRGELPDNSDDQGIILQYDSHGRLIQASGMSE